MLRTVGRWLFWALSALAIGYMCWSVIFSDHGYLVYRKEAGDIVELKQELIELKAERERLAAEILRLREDPAALEELVHRELGYVHPDEIMVIMPSQGEAQDVRGEE